MSNAEFMEQFCQLTPDQKNEVLAAYEFTHSSDPQLALGYLNWMSLDTIANRPWCCGPYRYWP